MMIVVVVTMSVKFEFNCGFAALKKWLCSVLLLKKRLVLVVVKKRDLSLQYGWNQIFVLLSQASLPQNFADFSLQFSRRKRLCFKILRIFLQKPIQVFQIAIVSALNMTETLSTTAIKIL